MKKDKKNPLGASFGYAFEGILTGIRKERNMKIHCLAIVAVTCAGTLFHITPVEVHLSVALCPGASLELVNTAVEGGGGPGDGRAQTVGEDRQRHGCGRSALCRDHIGDHRSDHFSAVCIGNCCGRCDTIAGARPDSRTDRMERKCII